ncbi:MAG: DUF3108 domain-containing protein [Candidatus Omnitrophica bacterium]|nr:DUF3108 domain-containing protein [Candidatus Omnitrophota bacterium]MDD4012919.1 DUF3108 domain-containing protein [Candidatus Omnitrophota bacterium]
MKRIVPLILCFSLTLSLVGCAGTGKVKPLAPSDIEEKEEVSVSLEKRRELIVGKRFIYNIAWNGIPVGRVIGECGEEIEYRGYKVYPVRIRTESNRYLSKIYRVEDVYYSFVDASDMTSRRYEADRKEGRYRKHVIVEYDHNAGKAVYTNLTDGSVKTCDIRDQVHDPVSAFCFFMTLPVKEGDRVSISVNLNEKNFDLYSLVEGFGTVTVPSLGDFRAFRITPLIILKGKEYRKGRAQMYFSAGEKRYPLYGVVWIPFGKVTATLDRVEDVDQSLVAGR